MVVTAEEARARGISALRGASWIEAEEALTVAVMRAPFDPIARHDLALVQRLRGHLEAARRSSATAVSLDHPDLLVRATILRQHSLHERLAGRHEDAGVILDRALEADPHHPVGWYLRGLFARLEGSFSLAVDGFARALRAGPLPALLRARIAGMLADLHTLGPDRLAATDSAAMVAAVSEPLGADGASVPLELDLSLAAGSHASADGDPRTVPGRSAREVTAESAAEMVHRARSITVLTGAGCSAASGLATRKELWRRFDQDAVVTVTHHSLHALWLVVMDLLGADPARPNPAHQVIAALPRVRAIVTQNVDTLHQAARDEAMARAPRAAGEPRAAPPVVELHGSLDRLCCARCGVIDPRTAGAVVRAPTPRLPPVCAGCGAATVRPDVVLFGEWVRAGALAHAVTAVGESDLLLIVGCAMDVAPASELPRLAAARGATVLEVNAAPSRLARSLETSLLRGRAEETLPAMFRALQALEPLGDLPPPLATPAPRAIEVELRVPSPGPPGAAGYVGEYLVREGQTVRRGEPCVLLEQDKVTVDLEAPIDGTLVRCHRREGDAVHPGELLATVRPDAERTVAELARTSAARRRVRPPCEPAAIARRHGAHPAAVRALFARICAGRLLCPERALSALSADGVAWLEARAQELRAALGVDRTTLPLRVFGDARTALEAVRADPLLADLTAESPELPTWLRVLASVDLDLDEADGSIEVAPPGDLLACGADEALLHARYATTAGARTILHTLPTSLRALAWRAARRVARTGDSSDDPFAPLLALWLGGAWPFALGAALGVWVPRYEGDAVVCDAQGDTPEARARWPHFLGERVQGPPRIPSAVRGVWSLERGWPFA